jgi:SPP1 gp7 family putative phage head morphogenesis protein
VADTPPQGLLQQVAAQYQAALQDVDDTARYALALAWVDAAKESEAAMDAFLEQVAARRAAGLPVSPAWAYQEARYKTFIATAHAQAQTFGVKAHATTVKAQQQALGLGLDGAAGMGSAAVAGAGIAATFVQVNPANMAHLLGYLQDGSPLLALFQSLAPQSTDAVKAALVAGIVAGRGVPRMRRDLRQALAIPRWRAETIARTEAHRVFRAASQATYAANADVLAGWVWLAHLDSRTCPACIAMHGTLHDVTDTLDGHPRCRCAMVPQTKPLPGMAQPQMPQTGQAWFEAQPEKVQRAILGPGKYAALKAGRIDFQDVVTRTHSPEWGSMRRESTLGEAIAAKKARTPRAALPAPSPAQVQGHLKGLQSGKFTPDELLAAAKGYDPQTQANVREAVAQYKAWQAAPEPTYVQAMLDAMVKGEYTPADLLKHVEGASIQGKINARAAVAKYSEQKAAEAAEKAARAGRPTTRGRRFARATEGRAWAYNIWGPTRYSADEFAAIRSYTGSGYRPMNRALREGRETVSQAGVGREVRALDAAMERAPRVPEPVVVTRNTGTEAFQVRPGADLSTLVGKSFTEHGFLSTSVNAKGAMSGNVRLSIRVPEGSRAVYVSGDATGKGAISAVGHRESELLLDRGGSLTVTKVTRRDGRWLVEADYTPRG